MDVKIGCCDTEDEVGGQLTMFMSKTIFEKIETGEYTIRKLPYTEDLIKIYDEQGREVSPIIKPITSNKGLEF